MTPEEMTKALSPKTTAEQFAEALESAVKSLQALREMCELLNARVEALEDWRDSKEGCELEG